MTNTTPNAGPLTLLQAADVARWYDEFAPRLRGFAARYLLQCATDAADVDDLLQDVFIRLMRDMARFARLDHAHRANYCYQTTRWVAYDAYRVSQARRLAATPLSAVAQAAMGTMEPLTASHDWQASMQPEQTTEARMTLRAVWDATPERYRALLTLLAAGCDRVEMAARLETSVRAVDVRLWRLRQVLREAGEKIV